MVKNKKITFSITQAQYDTWKKMAEEKDITFSEFVRRAVDVYIKLMERYKKGKIV